MLKNTASMRKNIAYKEIKVMFKKFVSLFLTAVMIICASLSLTSCGSKTPEYEQKELNLMGFYSPYDISEEG